MDHIAGAQLAHVEDGVAQLHHPVGVGRAQAQAVEQAAEGLTAAHREGVGVVAVGEEAQRGNDFRFSNGLLRLAVAGSERQKRQ